ncbi:MAG: hypothetical protein KAJ23_13000 [Maribacter sp.]|nr:hypothetical protein [Maribacter sp.]
MKNIIAILSCLLVIPIAVNVQTKTITYDEIAPFCKELAAVRQGDLWGFIDEEANQIIDFRVVLRRRNEIKLNVIDDILTEVVLNTNGEIIWPINERKHILTSKRRYEIPEIYTTSSFSQNLKQTKSSKKNAVNQEYTFVPPKKLQNKEIWTRVSNTRFECNFLRLAVEYKNFEFILYEMDGEKRELSRASKYSILSKEIAMNTVRVSPNYPVRPKTRFRDKFPLRPLF